MEVSAESRVEESAIISAASTTTVPTPFICLALTPPFLCSIEFFLWHSMQCRRNLEMASLGMKANWSATW